MERWQRKTRKEELQEKLGDSPALRFVQKIINPDFSKEEIEKSEALLALYTLFVASDIPGLSVRVNNEEIENFHQIFEQVGLNPQNKNSGSDIRLYIPESQKNKLVDLINEGDRLVERISKFTTELDKKIEQAVPGSEPQDQNMRASMKEIAKRWHDAEDSPLFLKAYHIQGLTEELGKERGGFAERILPSPTKAHPRIAAASGASGVRIS